MQTINVYTKKIIMCFGAVTMLTACVQHDLEQESTEPNATLTITLEGKALSRSTGALPSDEAKINRIAVGIFGVDGKVNTIQEIEVSAMTDGKTAKVDCKAGNNLTVIVVANAPAGLFTGLLYKRDFLSQQVRLSQTVAQGGTYQDAANLPMSGLQERVYIVSGTQNTLTIDLTRLVARVSLSKVHADFTGGTYPHATFKLTDIYLHDAATRSTIDPDNTSTGILASGLDETGQPSVAYLHHSLTHQFPGTDLTDLFWFYTFANADKDNPTKLVLKGDFDEDGSGPGDVSTVYYPVTINQQKEGTTWTGGGVHDMTVGINTTYDIGITIKSKGTSGPDVEPHPADLFITVTVKDWALNIKQNVVFE